MILRKFIVVLAGSAAAIAIMVGGATAQRIVVFKGVHSEVADIRVSGEATEKVKSEAPPPSAEPSADTGAEVALPEIVRGDIPPPPAELAAVAEEAVAGARIEWRPIGGEGRGVWFLNREQGLLVGCRMVGSGHVGRPKEIRCTEETRIPVFSR